MPRAITKNAPTRRARQEAEPVCGSGAAPAMPVGATLDAQARKPTAVLSHAEIAERVREDTKIGRLHGLPFAAVRPGAHCGIDWWAAKATGDLYRDDARGEYHADALIRYCRTYPDQWEWLLPFIVERMIQKGRWDRVAFGFVSRLANLLEAAHRSPAGPVRAGEWRP